MSSPLVAPTTENIRCMLTFYKEVLDRRAGKGLGAPKIEGFPNWPEDPSGNKTFDAAAQADLLKRSGKDEFLKLKSGLSLLTVGGTADEVRPFITVNPLLLNRRIIGG